MPIKDSSTAFDDPVFRRVIIASTAGAMGALFASMTALDRGEVGFEFHWSPWAVPAFAAGVLLGWGYWRLMFRVAARKGRGETAGTTMAWASVGLLAVAVASFLYPLRFSEADRRTDVAIGLAVAVGALSMGGWLVRRLVRAFEEESAPDPDERGGRPDA